MTYELAKELKDAGFPQPVELVEWCGYGRYEDWRNCVQCTIRNADREPTLSELIEACGEKFESLRVGKYEAEWLAFSEDKRGLGATPDIAVARLWLALNKHD